MNCTRCRGCGFLNAEQLPYSVPVDDVQAVLAFMATESFKDLGYDVAVCDCCGNGQEWYGTPGQHYGPDDPKGPNGPYAGNGGLASCH